MPSDKNVFFFSGLFEMIHQQKKVKWPQTLTFRILVVILESINEFVLIWSIKVALFLDILVGLVTVTIKSNIEVIH